MLSCLIVMLVVIAFSDHSQSVAIIVKAVKAGAPCLVSHRIAAEGHVGKRVVEARVRDDEPRVGVVDLWVE